MDTSEGRINDQYSSLRNSGGNIQQISSLYSNENRGVYCASCKRHLLTEDVVSGLKRNGRMSVVRRFFCLFVTFDVLFASLMWFISIVLQGHFNFYDVFYSEIVHYHIRTSFFDIVMVALGRFLALVLFYGIIQIDHWIIVAITTAGTCAFIVAKVYLFDWSSTQQPVLQVLLILSSFIIAWAEAWFFDLRVVPQEKHAAECLHVITNNEPNETSPLLRRFLHRTSRFDTASESVGTFYSPVPSEDSGSEGDETEQRARHSQSFSREMVELFKEKGEEILETAWYIVNSDGWKLDRETPEGDKISSLKLPTGKQVFKLVGKMNLPPMIIFDVLWTGIEAIPTWNPSMKDSKIIEVVNNSTDICYQLTADAGGGLITSRDFVLLRHWEEKYGYTIIASVSVSCPWIPANKKYIRGENGPGCWAIRDTNDGQCELIWLLNSNIKGWLPPKIVNSSLVGAMSEYVTQLRKHLCHLQASA